MLSINRFLILITILGTLISTISAYENLISSNNISITPREATIGELTTFQVIGENIPLSSAIWIDNCQDMTKLDGATSSGFQFSCTHQYQAGLVSGILKEESGGTVMKEFDIIFKANQIDCTPDIFEPDNNLSMSTVTQSGSVNTHSFCSSDDIDWMKITLSQPSKVLIDATGNYSYPGVDIKLYNSDDRLIANSQMDELGKLHTDCVNPLPVGEYFIKSSVFMKSDIVLSYDLSIVLEPCINTSGGTVESVQPKSANFGEETIFTVTGENLPNTTAFWIHNCANLVKLSGSNSSQVQFQCTPLYSYGMMPGVVKDKSGGILLKKFNTSISNNINSTEDSFEPDNTFTNQNIIINNQTQSRSLSSNSDVDWVSFTLNSPSFVEIDITGTEGDTMLSLYNEDVSRLIKFNDDKSVGNYLSALSVGQDHPLDPGTYKIKIESYNHLKKIDDYQLSLIIEEAIKDTDNDGYSDNIDAFPEDASEWFDTDNDGIGNNADTDDDNDGVVDNRDAFPLNSQESIDTDNDGIGNNTDLDDDNDGISDVDERKWGFNPLDASDGNNVDKDGDGVSNADEIEAGSSPLDPNDTKKPKRFVPIIMDDLMIMIPLS